MAASYILPPPLVDTGPARTGAVPAAAVVGEAMVCWVLADALLERYGADTVSGIEAAIAAARARTRERFGRPAAHGLRFGD